MKIAVIGGGVVGLSCALRLAQAGNAVTLLDQSRRHCTTSSGDAASWGNAGHIATEQIAPLASLTTLRSVPDRLFVRGGALDLPLASVATWLPFALRMLAAARPARFEAGKHALGDLLAEALPAWRKLVTAIAAPELLDDGGHFVVWESAATAASGRAAWRSADTGTANVSDASAQQLDRLKRITRAAIGGAVHFSGTGQITDLDALATALAKALCAAGGSIVKQQATLRLEAGRAMISGPATALPDYAPDAVLVAAGVGSAALLAPFGHHVPIIAERGYHIRGTALDWPADLSPLVFEDRSMIVTRFGERVQAASFVEFGRADAPPDLRKWERLERHVGDLGLPFGGPFTRWMGCRPTLPDYLPAIGRSRRANNLFYAFGHQHLGLTLAPITAEIVADVFADAPGRVDLTPFDLDRFGG